jgi:hypothetical protein
VRDERTGGQTHDPQRIPSLGGRERHAFEVPAYREINSANEILLIDSESIYAEILRREGDRWIAELVQRGDATHRLSSVDLQIAMAELYEGINVEAENAA